MTDENFPLNLNISPSKDPDSEAEPDVVAQDVEHFGIAGRIWEGAYLLHTYLGAHSEDTETDPPGTLTQCTSPKVILELGSGTGYVGLKAAELLSPRDLVILTDLPSVCPLLLSNTDRARRRWSEACFGPRKCATVWAKELTWGEETHLDALAKDLRGSRSSSVISHIICSDLVYFPPLLPLLLRSLLSLTSPPFSDPADPPVVIFSYKIRSYAFESPFWSAFGAYFDLTPVYERRKLCHQSSSGESGWSEWKRMGANATTDESFIFLGTRKKESLAWRVPDSNDELMNCRGDASFETMLMMCIDI